MAVVLDAPDSAHALGRTAFDGAAGEVLEATIRAVIAASGRRPPADLLDEVAVFHAVARPVAGGKAPSVVAVRACHERLVEELSSARPRMILTVGAAACASLAGVGALKIVATPITSWRGMMRWVRLPSGNVPWVATISSGSVVGKTDFYRDLSADVWKAWTQAEPTPDPEVVVDVPTTYDDLVVALSALDGASVVTCDVETTGLKPWRDVLLSVGFGAVAEDPRYGLGVIVPFELLSDSRVQDLCWDYAYRATRRTVFQNGKFDLQYLMRWFGEASVPRDALLGDTLLLGYLLDERPKKDRIGSLGLKEQASYRYDKQDYHWDWEKFYNDMRHDGSHPDGRTCDPKLCAKQRYPHPDTEPRADWAGLYAYQGLDVYFTARMWYDQVAEAADESEGLMRAHDEVLVPAMKILAACELVGAPLDRAWLTSYASWLRRRIGRRSAALALVSRDLGAPDDFEYGAPLQVADLMYDVWKMTPDVRKRKKFGDFKPDRSTDKEHIEAAIVKYVSSHDPTLARAARWLRTLLRWRTEAKQLSTYSESILDAADSDDRIHASFWLHGTITGRLSSSQPNLQNIPAVDDKVYEPDGRVVYQLRGDRKTRWPARKGFGPRPGHVWIEADYSQLELRVAAWLSGDERLKEVFINGRDIHREVASTMFSKPPEEITKPERYLAKAVDFGLLYGRQPKAVAEGKEMDFYERELGGRRWDIPTAEAFIRKFLRGYPQLASWLETNARDAVNNYFVSTPFGRRRRFPFKPRDKWARMAIERQANNTPIQSAASDLCLQAMWRIDARLPEGATLLFPVHDSICLEVRDDLLDEVKAILREEMELDVGGVPLTIDVEVGHSWADVH